MIVEANIRSVSRNVLPRTMELYETDGRCFFEMRESQTVRMPNKVFILVDSRHQFKFYVELTPADSVNDLRRKILSAISDFQAELDTGGAEKADDLFIL